ncbi:MAG: hypothetical protein RBU25_17490 [Lentisphaeria bacterium]|nr:hypothetical protein [Lentisphaeria bacterium]
MAYGTPADPTALAAVAGPTVHTLPDPVAPAAGEFGAPGMAGRAAWSAEFDLLHNRDATATGPIRRARISPAFAPDFVRRYAVARGWWMAGGYGCFNVGVAPVRRRRVWPIRRSLFELGERGLRAGTPFPGCRVPSPHGGGSHFWVRRARGDSS